MIPRILVLSILFLSASGHLQSQDLTIVPFAKFHGGYGTFRGYTESNIIYASPDPYEERTTYEIFNGFDYSFTLGGAILRKGNDIYSESFLDLFLVHRRISGSSNGARITGIGAQVRYKFFYGGIIAGKAGNESKFPIGIDENSSDQIYGDLHGVTPMFSLGLRAPLNPGRTLFIDIPFDFAIPRNRMKDDPKDAATLFEWYSLNIGLCYYLNYDRHN